MDANERARRYRARKRGEDVPKEQPGPKPGYQQSEEHINKRKRFGPDHPNWKGDEITVKSGRSRALRGYPPAPCEQCGVLPSERHHVDGNPKNNSPENVRFLCRKCHMAGDGRLDEFRKLARENQPKATTARWDKTVLPG